MLVAVLSGWLSTTEIVAQSLFDAPGVAVSDDVVSVPPIQPPIPPEERPVATRPRTLEESKVIARVNGQVVLACEVLWMVNFELEHRLSSVPRDQREKIPPEQLEQLREMLSKQILLGVIDRKIRYTNFRTNVPQADLNQIHSRLDEPFQEKEIPRLMEAFKAENLQDLESKLHKIGTSIAEQRETFYEQMIAHSWIREQLQVDETVTHEDMLAYYREHHADYEFPTQVRWEELMIRYDRSPGNNWEERKANAYHRLADLGNLLWQRVQKSPPENPVFADVAKSQSHGVNAADGGQYDWTTQGALRSETLNGAIFSLAPGQMSDILATDDGFHIVRVLQRKEAGRTPFTQVQAEISDKIITKRREVAAQEKIDNMRREARIWTAYDGQTTADALFSKPNGPVRR